MVKDICLYGLLLLMALGSTTSLRPCCQMSLATNADVCCHQNVDTAMACCAKIEKSASQTMVQNTCACHNSFHAVLSQRLDLQLSDVHDFVAEHIPLANFYTNVEMQPSFYVLMPDRQHSPPGELYYLYRSLLI